MEEKSEKEKKIRAITKMYYSNPKVQEAILNFAANREVVPRYFEGFGKRPDMIQYPSDILGLINKGATSLHASEETWPDPLHLSSDITKEQMDELRKSWDLLIDIDSPFLDCSKIAAKLIISALEHNGIKNYGLKFSGSKGYHLIVSGKAFPEFFNGIETRKMFPEWPRAISEYLMDYIKIEYNNEVGKILNVSEVSRRTNISEEDLAGINCVRCGRAAQKGSLVNLYCPVCNLKIQRKDVKLTKRRLSCLNGKCPGVLEIESLSYYYFCEYCKDSDNDKIPLDSIKHPENFEKVKGIAAEKIANLDLVLVAPRHLFRMPYSLHEKTALASIVLKKEQLDSFSPRDADPFKVKFFDYLPKNEEGEAKRLLSAALEWKRNQNKEEEIIEKRKYEEYQSQVSINSSELTEDMFPDPIKKLLKGLKDGKKRGLFILITFLRSLNFPPEFINLRIREWNKLNAPPLKEGYIKSQIDWHLKQKKKILPPNYDNSSFYKDLSLLDKKPTVKNPLVEVIRSARKRR